MSVHKKKFNPIGPAVWTAFGDIYTNVLFFILKIEYLSIAIISSSYSTVFWFALDLIIYFQHNDVNLFDISNVDVRSVRILSWKYL